MYRIIGYDIVNGTKTVYRISKKVIVQTLEEINEFERQKESEYFEQHGELCQVYAIYKTKII